MVDLKFYTNLTFRYFFKEDNFSTSYIFWTSGVFSITHIKSISNLLKTFSFLLHLCIVHSKDLFKNNMNLGLLLYFDETQNVM